MAKKTTTRKKTTKKKPAKATPAVQTAAADAGPAHPPPIALAELVGQRRAASVIEATIRSGRVHHCWLFSGPRGVGKFTAALSFAALLLDPTTGPDLSGALGADPDGEVARLLRAATHPDLHIVNKELAAYSREASVRSGKQTTIPVDVLREFLIEPATLGPRHPPGGLASRVFIVDEAELMGGGQRVGQNALLKTLEEPPPGAVIILVTESEERLLPTIRSRAQRVAFLPVAEGELRAWAAARYPEVAVDVLDRAVAFADGSPGVLRELIEDDVLAWHDTIEPMLDEAAGGRFPAALGGQLTKLADEWAKGWVKHDERRSKEMANRVAATKLFRVIGLHARRMLRSRDRVVVGVAAAHAVTRAEQRLAANTQMSMVMEGIAADLAEAGRRQS
ncbi:MAG: hypothetical protein CMJ31_09380 [Phycisphaerae bacterium]|nr:hypothetical protein [Phycisphaerae bacterium]